MRQYVNLVNKAKESIALDALEQLFPAPDYRITKQWVSVLVLQHKWLIGPDTAKESASNDDELRKGTQQVVKSRDAFRADPQLLRKALRLTSTDHITQIEAAVVCRGSESTGFMPESQVPVVSERAFRLLLEKAKGVGHFGSL